MSERISKVKHEGAKVRSLKIAGKTYKLTDAASSSAVLPSEMDLLAGMLESITDESATPQTLPRTLIFDGKEHDTYYWRMQMAIARGESSAEVSDLDVLRLISRTGIDGPPRRFTISSIIDNFPSAVEAIRDRLENPQVKAEAARIHNLYRGRRGLMVVDVVASRQRRYKSAVVERILPAYQAATGDLGLDWLSHNEPVFLRLRAGEAKTMQQLAQFLKSFSSGPDDELTNQNFVRVSNKPGVRYRAISISGIGPVLYEYLRLLAGADTIKIDSRVRSSLRAVGIPQHLLSDEGLLELCEGIVAKLGCSLVELDQALWLETGREEFEMESQSQSPHSNILPI